MMVLNLKQLKLLIMHMLLAYQSWPGHPSPALLLENGRNYVVGLDNETSEALLDELWAAATNPELAWTHQWRVGDAVLWDNRCTMHYRTEVNPNLARVMHRAVIKGEPLIPATA